MSDPNRDANVASLRQIQEAALRSGANEAAKLSPGARPKTQALSLLSGIMEETESEAEAERQRMEAELRRKDEEARKAAIDEERRKREEAERRLAEEELRVRAQAERRAAAAEQLRIEDLKEKGLWVEPPKPEVKPEAAQPQVVQLRPTMSTGQAIAVAQKANRRGMLAAAAAVVVIGGGLGAFFVFGQKEFVDVVTAYPKSEPTVVMLADASTSIAFREIPRPIVVEAAPEPEQSGGSRRPRGNRNNNATTEPNRPTIRLGGNLGGGR